MGNEQSQEEEQFYKTEYEEPLDSPNVDRVVNSGTTAPNCQPKHTKKEEEKAAERAAAERAAELQSQEVGLNDSSKPELMGTDSERAMDAKYRRDDSSEDRRRQRGQEKQKLSYIQMAKMGYQELVNAIIRPPRAEYKVRR